MGWLSDWRYRRQITIPSSSIASELSNFPIMLYLSNSSGTGESDITSIFNELGSSSKKIAVTTSNGTTQCYIEVVRWDSVNELAWLYIKVPIISDSQDTTLYLYYDSNKSDNTTYVGTPGSTPAQQVWDDNFIAVYHLEDSYDGTVDEVIDSTQYEHNGKAAGAGPIQSDGRVGKCQYFDEVALVVSLINDHFSSSEATLECWIKTTGEDLQSDNRDPFSYRKDGENNHYPYTDNDIYMGTFRNDRQTAITTQVTLSNWHYLVVVNKNEANGWKLLQNMLTAKQTAGESSVYVRTSGTEEIGGGGVGGYEFKGYIDEVRISNTRRSNDWLNATLDSDNDDLVLFGEEEVLSLAQYIFGSVSPIDNFTIKYFSGNPEMVGRLSEYLLGDLDIVNGRSSYLYGTPNIIYGNSNYLYVVPTIVSRIPKPIYGRVYQRISSVEKEVN